MKKQDRALLVRSDILKDEYELIKLAQKGKIQWSQVSSLFKLMEPIWTRTNKIINKRG